VATKYKLFLLAFVLSLGLDQATKLWARSALRPRSPEVVTVVPGYFDLQYAENTGVAFSLLRGRPDTRYLTFVFGPIALAVMAVYLRRAAPTQGRLGAELGLVASGAVGNLIDRVAYGHVTDFILWHIGEHRWPTFNIADAALVVGVIGLVFDLQPAPKQTTS
jgi:signal peptidase II